MYEKFFYFNERPFRLTPDPQFLYLSRGHAEALDLLSYGIRDRRGCILMTGEVGTGKTTLCRALIQRLPKNTACALVLNPLMSAYDLLKTINADFGISSRATGEIPPDTAKSHLSALNDFLLRLTARGGNAAIIIDEAQTMTQTSLEMLRMLSNLETEKQKLLQIVLVGQPELDARVRLKELRQLNQRIAVRCQLSPLDLADTHAYIDRRITVAGGVGSVSFTKGAVARIHAKSGGCPRAINVVCDRALAAAFVAGKRVVDSSIADMAAKELESEGYLSRASDGGVIRTLARFFGQISA